jgi:hypothetical protein
MLIQHVPEAEAPSRKQKENFVSFIEHELPFIIHVYTIVLSGFDS